MAEAVKLWKKAESWTFGFNHLVVLFVPAGSEASEAAAAAQGLMCDAALSSQSWLEGAFVPLVLVLIIKYIFNLQRCSSQTYF